MLGLLYFSICNKVKHPLILSYFMSENQSPLVIAKFQRLLVVMLGIVTHFFAPEKFQH